MKFLVTIHKPRPDFRVFIDLLFGPDRNVDSDGDADPVWSREWRELSLKDRESETPRLEIYAPDPEPTAFGVMCEQTDIAELSALYLYLYCGEAIARDGEALNKAEIERLKRKHMEALARAERAVWHLSGAEHHFPNLSIEDSCGEARTTLLFYQRRPHNESVLKMALEGMIEIEDGILDSAEAEAGARHVETCEACTAWLDDFYPNRAAEHSERERLRTTYCCASMQHAINDTDAQTRFKFVTFRGEDPCWAVNEVLCFARYCPWCGKALPDGPF